MLKKILRWPENKRTGWVPLIYFGICFTWVFVLCGFGKKTSAIFWDFAT